ncbi:b3107f60-dbf2-4996-9891-32150759b650 [Sclerotinia trifoliorum]|uniref:B3107f60-dbf2-4996-9891-32150759b650 n=1 Tax=Sclerotinia trifoliorum TaxID=28548 RepID=A0A8H2VYW2_9HELO|nr:b3107f60-dbf2-4996-9891-32150759b650 [Sclerotinia trifoliorum]
MKHGTVFELEGDYCTGIFRELWTLLKIEDQTTSQIEALESQLQNRRIAQQLEKCRLLLEEIDLRVEILKIESKRMKELLEKMKDAREKAPSLLESIHEEIDEDTRDPAPSSFSSFSSASSAGDSSTTSDSFAASSSSSSDSSSEDGSTISDSSAPRSPPMKPEIPLENLSLDEQLEALIEEGRELDRSQRESGIWN